MTLLFKVRMPFCNEFVDSNAIGYIRRLAGIFYYERQCSFISYQHFKLMNAGATAKREYKVFPV